MSNIKKLSLAALGIVTMLSLPQAAFAHDNDRGRHDNGHHNGHVRDNRDYQWNDPRGNHNHLRVARPIYVTPHVVAPRYYSYRAPVVYYNVHPRHYVGQRLVTYYPVPMHVQHRLAPCPRGYYYSYYDDNVYLVRQQDNVIAQIISLLVR